MQICFMILPQKILVFKVARPGTVLLFYQHFCEFKATSKGLGHFEDRQFFLFAWYFKVSEKKIGLCSDKKEKFSHILYKEIEMGSVAKSYMKKGFPICEEMRKYLTLYEEAVSHI